MNKVIFPRLIPFLRPQLLELVILYCTLNSIYLFINNGKGVYFLSGRASMVFLVAFAAIVILRWLILVPNQIEVFDNKLVLSRRIFKKKVILFSEISEIRERPKGIAIRLNNGRVARIASTAYNKNDLTLLIATLNAR